jgi:branched-chain amino acid transport system permease protein
LEQFLQQLLNGIAWGSIYALIALGYTMVYGVLKLINFAHGEVYMVGAMAGYYAAHALGFATEPSLGGFFVVLLLAMAACGLLGATIERVAYRPLRNAPRLASLITAIGISLLLQNGGQILFGADPKFFPSLVAAREVVRFGSLAVSNIQLFVFGTAMLLMFGLELVVMRTRFGRAMRAVSVDAPAAALMGVPVDRVISGTFVLGSALAAAAGVLVGLSNPKIDPLMGLLPGLKAFVAAVLGGIGSIPGAMIGGLLLGVVETLVSAYLSSTYRDAIAFVILIAILLYRPTGLFGTAQVEKV